MPDLRTLIPSLLLALAVTLGPLDEARAASIRWADTVVGPFIRGPQDRSDPFSPLTSSGSPGDALGAPDNPGSGADGLVSLGEDGSIILSFLEPLLDLPGPDLVVHSNPSDFGEFGLFVELATVEVSSNGIDWSGFATQSLVPRPEGESWSFLTIDDASLFSGFAGVRIGGDLFDLAELLHPERLDLSAIRLVRISDVVGDGTALDSFGNPIFDPWRTLAPTSGFDLDAVGVPGLVPEPAGLVLLAMLGVLLGRAGGRERTITPPA